MNNLLSCRYNMDTNRVEARFEGGTISPLAATTADWKSNNITNTAPLWRRRSQSGAVFNEGEMMGISGYRFSSNCSAVMVALPSAAKVMPSADWGV